MLLEAGGLLVNGDGDLSRRADRAPGRGRAGEGLLGGETSPAASSDGTHCERACLVVLERAGATVESAYDGRQAVEIASSATFDVLLIDLRMPHTDGFAATRILRSRGYALPIIALTADPTTIYHEEALEAGCDACLAKPFKLAELSTAIRRSSRGRR